MIKSTPPCCMECEKRFMDCSSRKCIPWVEWFTRIWKEIQKLAKEDDHERS